jgi:hypothetical protein
MRPSDQTQLRALLAAGTPAVVYRSIDAFRPTLMMDEGDKFMRSSRNSALIGILNASHRRRSPLPRPEGLTRNMMEAAGAAAASGERNGRDAPGHGRTRPRQSFGPLCGTRTGDTCRLNSCPLVEDPLVWARGCGRGLPRVPSMGRWHLQGRETALILRRWYGRGAAPGRLGRTIVQPPPQLRPAADQRYPSGEKTRKNS